MAISYKNANNNLGNDIKSLLANTKSLDILVGYFYFSGFQILYKELKDKHIRILIGMEIDPNIIKNISSLNEQRIDTILCNPTSHALKSSIIPNFISTFATIINSKDEFDTEEAEEAFEVFFQK